MTDQEQATPSPAYYPPMSGAGIGNIFITPEQIANDQWLAYVRARDNGHGKFVQDAKLHDRFYVGDQWDEDALKKLDAERRPHQTINLILTTINAVVGEYIGQRQDIVYRPRSRGALDGTAKCLTKLAKVVTDDSHSRWVEKQVFMDGLITDRGFFDMRLCLGDNILGEIQETAFDPVDVLLDPGAREYDPKSWQEVFTTRWMTPDEVEAYYNQKIADTVRYMNPGNTFGSDSVSFDPATFSQDKSYYTNGPLSAAAYEQDWKRTHRVRVIERQFYVMTTRKYFVDSVTGDMAPVPDKWTPERIDAVIKHYGLYIYSKQERRIRWRVTADKQVLTDVWSPYRRFTIIPFFPYFRRGKPFGLVRNLISPQELLNKTTSQELHVVNTTANSGWIVEEGTLVNMTVEELKQSGAQSGVVIVHQRNSTAPSKIQANQIPTGLDRLSSRAGGFFRDISGVSDAMLGQPGREISGEALQRKEMRGLVQLDTVFDNLALTRQMRAEFMLEMFQDFYTDTRVFKIISSGEDGEQMTEEVKLNYQNEAGEIVNDVTLGEYGVVVSSRPARDVEDDSQFQQMIQMRETGIMVPDWAIMEASSLDNKAEIADWIRKTQGAAAPTEEQIQAQQQDRELQIRRAIAEIEQLQAKTQNSMAQAALFEAQAGAAGGEAQAEIVKFGAKLRQEMEASQADLEKTKNDLLTRLAIAQSKNETTRYAATLGALTDRLKQESQERIASIVAANRKRSES